MRRWIANKLLKHLFNAVTEDDVLRHDGARLTLRGKPLSQAQVAELQSAAESIRGMNLWRLLTAELRHQANLMIYERSTTADDLIFGKAVLYAVDIMEKKLEIIAKLK